MRRLLEVVWMIVWAGCGAGFLCVGVASDHGSYRRRWVGALILTSMALAVARVALRR